MGFIDGVTRGVLNELSKGPMYEIEIQHPGLNKHRVIRGRDRSIIEQKANDQLATWDAMWERRLQASQTRQARESLAQYKKEKKQLAVKRTNEAEESFARLSTLLERTLLISHVIELDEITDKRLFPNPEPQEPAPPKYPPKPKRTWECYTYQPNILFRLIPSLGRRRQKELVDALRLQLRAWRVAANEVTRSHTILHDKYRTSWEQWLCNRDAFLHEQEDRNRSMESMLQGYQNGDRSAVVEYFRIVLEKSEYPDSFPMEHEYDYLAEDKTLVVDYSLPTIDCIPNVKAVKYVQCRDEFVESYLSNKVHQQKYDDVIYQVILATLHKLFTADTARVLESVILNGIVRHTDAATGHSLTRCTVSVQAERDEFLQFNLQCVDPHACFRQLKGRGSASLHSLVPVVPIQQISHDDRRFVSAQPLNCEAE